MRFFIVILAVFLMSCAALESGKASHAALPRTPEMEKTFQTGERLFTIKKFPEAKLVYQSFLSQFSYNALTTKTDFRLGEIYFQEGDYPKALSYYKKALDRQIDPEWGEAALYKEAVTYSKLDDSKKVLLSLNRLSSSALDWKIGLRAGSLRVSTAKKLQDLLEEQRGYLELLNAYEAVPPTETDVGDLNWIVRENMAREQVRAWVLTDESGKGHLLDELKNWEKEFHGKSGGGYVSWKIARLYHQDGKYQDAASWARDYLQTTPKHEFTPSARALLSEIDKREGSPASSMEARSSIGVLLPLTGPYAVYGESVLHGLECADGIYAPCRGDLGVNLVIRDTQGNPKRAAEIVEEFSKMAEVKAVVGPLLQAEVDEAVSHAEAAGLPMVVLSQKANVAKSGQFIFRNFLTVADQVATLVDYVCQDKKWKKLAILYPEGPTGKEYLEEFEKQVDQCGGKVVAKAGYAEGTKDFTETVRQLKFSTSEENIEQSVPFEALFIPDVYRRVPQVAATLKAAGIEGIHLLGGAGWDHPALVEKGGAAVEGALFVDGFFVKSTNYATRDFVSSFQSAYGDEPTLLEAYGYDTLKLLGDALKDQIVVDRASFQKILSGKKDFNGVTGKISFDEEGDACRRLTLLTVEQGEIKEVR